MARMEVHYTEVHYTDDRKIGETNMTNWYYHDPAQGRVGPIDADALREHFRAARIGRDTLLWRQGLSEWQPLERLANELGLDQELLSATPPPLPPSLPSQASNASGSAASAPTTSGRAVFDSAAPASAADDANASTGSTAPSQRSVSPADYAPAHVARRQAPPPKRGMSGCMIALIVLAALGIPVVAIVAAVALPAYQGYTLRAKVSAALATTVPYKVQIAEYYGAHSECPDNGTPGFKAPESYANAQIASVQIGRLRDNGHCGLQVELRGFNRPELDGKKIRQSFDPDGKQWNCISDIENPIMLPKECRSPR